MTVCRQCKEDFLPSDFYDLTSSPTGKHPNCKWCCKVNRGLESVRKRDKRSKVSVRQRVRAMGLGIKYDPDITLAGVYKKDRGICYLCKKWVQPRHASMDHKKALTNGGTHTHDNVALTHLRCNLVKGDRDHVQYVI